MKIKKQILIILMLINTIIEIKAQEAIPSSGGNVLGTGGTVSYTVGQVVYLSNTGTDGSVLQGVQQPYEIYVVTGIENQPDNNLTIKVYPNPVSTNLTLEIAIQAIRGLSYHLVDIAGKILENKKIIASVTEIHLEQFPSSTYFLKVIQDDLTSSKIELKTFKIIKN
jgi:hypothetical protein